MSRLTIPNFGELSGGNFLLEGLQAFRMGEGREQIYREGVPFHHNREREGPSGVVRCVATWKLELGCMPGSGATGWPVVLDGCGWWRNHGLELWRSSGVVELVQVRQCSHVPANPQALEQDPRAKGAQGTSLDSRVCRGGTWQHPSKRVGHILTPVE